MQQGTDRQFLQSHLVIPEMGRDQDRQAADIDGVGKSVVIMGPDFCQVNQCAAVTQHLRNDPSGHSLDRIERNVLPFATQYFKSPFYRLHRLNARFFGNDQRNFHVIKQRIADIDGINLHFLQPPDIRLGDFLVGSQQHPPVSAEYIPGCDHSRTQL